MKTAPLSLAILLTLSGLSAVAQTNAPAVTGKPSPLNFPGEFNIRGLKPTNRVTFQFYAPTAQKSVGFPSSAPTLKMVKGNDGVWTYTSAPKRRAITNYWYVVDGATNPMKATLFWIPIPRLTSVTAICAMVLKSPIRMVISTP